jgi:hypothetical protein
MRTLRSIFIGAAILFGACTKEAADVDLYRDPASISLWSDNPAITVSAEGQSAEVAVQSSGSEIVINVNASSRDWNVSETASWVSVDKIPSSITLVIEPNTTDMRREQYIKLTVGAESDYAEASVLVKQGKPGSELELSDNEIMLSAMSTEPYILELATDGDTWNFEIEATWLLVERVDEHSLSIVADPNRSPAARSAMLSVYSGADKNNPSQLIITQEGGSQLMIDRSLFTFDEAGGTGQVMVSTDLDSWSFECKADWITLQQKDNMLVLSVQRNTTALREATIEVRAGYQNNMAVQTITVSQISLDPDALVLRVAPVDFSYQYMIMSPAIVLNIGGSVDCMINWGDGTTEHIVSPHPHHTYPAAGVYYVTITGKVTTLSTTMLNEGYKQLITGVKSWGKTGLTSLSHAFEGCQITSIPDDEDGAFAEVLNFEYAFSGCAISEIPKNIFAKAVKAENFAHTFSKCENIRTIPQGLFDHTPNASNFDYTFSEESIAAIPANIFANCKNITGLNGTFYYNPYLTAIPAGIFDGANRIESFDNTFGLCFSIEAIPMNLFDNCPNVTSFNGTFSGCSGITEIPQDLFANCHKVTTFADVFSKCSMITVIPPTIFEKNTAVESFYATFANCTRITSIPEDIFKTNLRATNFQSTFEGLSRNLTTIPEGLFRNHPNQTSFVATFASCSSLTDIPEGLFANNRQVTKFDRVFMSCTGLKTLPTDLFKNNVMVTNFFGVFSNCSALTDIPEDIFRYNTEVTDFQNSFAGCSSLKQLPENMFRYNVKVFSMNGTFSACTGLTSIPEKLFSHNTEVWDFSSVFSTDRNLESIPPGLFDNNRKVGSFIYAFSQIRNMRGETPYTMVGDTKVHLYERQDYPSEFNAPGGMRCFYSDYNLTDYDNIPEEWKI